MSRRMICFWRTQTRRGRSCKLDTHCWRCTARRPSASVHSHLLRSPSFSTPLRDTQWPQKCEKACSACFVWWNSYSRLASVRWKVKPRLSSFLLANHRPLTAWNCPVNKVVCSLCHCVLALVMDFLFLTTERGHIFFWDCSLNIFENKRIQL